MRTWFFHEKSYKKIILRLVDESTVPRGMISRIATAIGCQRSYLSQILHSKMHITKDQAWNICHFFGFSEEEIKYFDCLVEYERSGSSAYRKRLEGQMSLIRQQAEKISNRFAETTGFSEVEAMQYYATWLPVAVRILSSIPEFQEPEKMMKRLGVSEPALTQTLETLQRQGLIKRNQRRWEFVGGTTYTPKDSLFVGLHHQNWRQLAVEDSRLTKSDGLHYTMVQSMTEADFERLKVLILDFISQTKKIADPSKPEILTALSLDFFQPRGEFLSD